MNVKKWTNNNVPPAILANKLSEEAAEVGGEITDAYMEGRSINVDNVLEEISHVRFFCDLIEKEVQR